MELQTKSFWILWYIAAKTCREINQIVNEKSNSWAQIVISIRTLLWKPSQNRKPMPNPDIATPDRTIYIVVWTSFATDRWILDVFEGSEVLNVLFIYKKRVISNVKKITANIISDFRSSMSFNWSLLWICLNTPYPNTKTNNQWNDFAKKLCCNLSRANGLIIPCEEL